MKQHWTAANTAECSGFLLRPIMRAACFPHSVWGVTHVLAQKQSRDCASSLGAPCLPYGWGNASMNKASRGCRPLKTTENRKLFAKDKRKKKKEKAPIIYVKSSLQLSIQNLSRSQNKLMITEVLQPEIKIVPVERKLQ